jgi:hypothetical protein
MSVEPRLVSVRCHSFGVFSILTLTMIALIVTTSGCDRGDPTVRAWGVPSPPPTPAERILLDQVTRDAFVQIAGMERDSEDRLLVTTTQGNRTVRYLLAPAADGGQDLVVRHVNEDLELVTAVEPRRSAKEPTRGLHR